MTTKELETTIKAQTVEVTCGGLLVAEVTVTETETGDLVITCEPCDGSGASAEGFIAKGDR